MTMIMIITTARKLINKNGKCVRTSKSAKNNKIENEFVLYIDLNLCMNSL